jgi:hypothetical protein
MRPPSRSEPPRSALSASVGDGAEMPVRREGQVSASHRYVTPALLLHAYSGQGSVATTLGGEGSQLGCAGMATEQKTYLA